MNEKNVELLAPVGCEENFYGAINYGADAVYLGLSDFSARKNAGNFTFDRLKFVVAYAHLFNVKVYVAVNTVIKNSELSGYFECIKTAHNLGVDAFIVQDIFLGRLLKKAFPGISLHLSTQAGINNVDGAKQAASYGFCRVVLARETPIEEIKKISQIIETEVFIQGALCTCFSGHCYFSSFIGGLSGNRGLCRQPCRKLYHYEGDGIRDENRYALSLSDLSMTNCLNDLILAGVKNFKIEGRMRSFEYVCASCDAYSSLLNGASLSKGQYENLKRTFNRGDYTEGYAYGQDKKLISDKVQGHIGSVVASVLAIKGNQLILSGLKHNIKEGDSFKVLTGGVETGHALAVNKNGKVVVLFKEKAFVGSQLAITKDISLKERYMANAKVFPVKAVVEAVIGQPLKLTLNGREYYSDFIVQPALTSAVTKTEIKENLRRKDVYPFEVTPSCVMNEKVFIPKKAMNALRASAYEEYFYSFAAERNLPSYEHNNVKQSDSDNGGLLQEIAVISNNFDFNAVDVIKKLIFCPNNYNDEAEFERFFAQALKFNAEKYLYLPAFLNSKDEKIVVSRLDGFDGVYCEGGSGIFLAKRYNKKIFGGIELNVTNNLTYEQLTIEGLDEISLSKELSRAELLQMNEGYVLSLGAIKIMSLMYCPFSKNCASCKRGCLFKLRDSANRVFPVRRYKLSECRFELYNESLLRSKFPFKKQIFDFTTLNVKQINELLDIYLKGKDNSSFNFTSGNLTKGVE